MKIVHKICEQPVFRHTFMKTRAVKFLHIQLCNIIIFKRHLKKTAFGADTLAKKLSVQPFIYLPCPVEHQAKLPRFPERFLIDKKNDLWRSKSFTGSQPVCSPTDLHVCSICWSLITGLSLLSFASVNHYYILNSIISIHLRFSTTLSIHLLL